MPQKVTLYKYLRYPLSRRGLSTTCATESELLEFANRVRKAGGTTILNELLLSRASNSQSCLIANACNFGCRVDVIDGSTWADGSLKWAMHLPDNIDEKLAKKIAKAVRGSKLKRNEYIHTREYYIILPKNIGNAAHAFDDGAAFTRFRVFYPPS